MVIWFFS